MSYTTITEFNTYLSNNLTNLHIFKYFKLIHEQFYKDLDISFMEYFLELCKNENEFIVEHIKLQEYKVINNIKSCNIKDCLTKSNLIENEDYQVLNVQQSRLNNQHGGYNGNKKQYILKPKAFKKCLIRAKNSQIYADYYLLLEQVYKNYQEYQIMYQKILLSGKDEKIDNLQKDIKKQSEKIDKQSEQIDELLKYGKDTNETVKRMEIKIDCLIKLVSKFLSNQIDILYTFKNQMLQTKVLIVFELESLLESNKYKLVLRYCSISELATSVTKLNKKYDNYLIFNFYIIGAIQENILTTQAILNNISEFDKVSKSTQDININEVKIIINKIIEIVNNKKIIIFNENIKKNKLLSEHSESMNELLKLDNKFNKTINKKIKFYLNEKVLNYESFKKENLCKELEKVYNDYTNHVDYTN